MRKPKTNIYAFVCLYVRVCVREREREKIYDYIPDIIMTQTAGAVEYNDCITAEG